MSLAEQILNADDRRTESVVIPEWDDARVYIRTMGALERSRYEAALVECKDTPLAERLHRVKITLVILCACDEEGSRLFDDSHFDQLAAKNGAAIDRLFEAINAVNQISDDEIEEERGN